ncbi:hypothetical protein [Sphingobacterium prati]|uniref:hypothetical protein n=1 Tax=Sphingobacterium prati TaxID=2737006 RepID=UPI001551E0B4|nr:hypothetical protein [Sphingobacterium prati]NPE48519.1 hypothetical protein [Sphingobacterium prati]
MKKINRFSLYVTNAVALRRCIAGKSPYALSIDLERNPNYVGNIEDPNRPDQYNSADYPSIAKEVECGLNDITPPDDWEVSNSHEKVDKEVVSLSDPNFVLKVLRGIKASRHAAKLNSLEELYQHLSPKNAKEKEIIKSVWEDFTKTNA